MAEDVKNNFVNDSQAQSEEYDPLRDYFNSSAHEFEPISEGSGDSPFSSIDSCTFQQVSPPILRREIKRDKEKQKLSVNLNRERKSFPSKNFIVGVIKDIYRDKSAWSSLKSFDSNEDLTESGIERREHKRRNSRDVKKTLSTTRSHDRLLKQQNVDDFHTPKPRRDSLSGIPLTPTQINVPNQYSTVNALPKVSLSVSLDSSATAMAYRRNTRSYSVSQGDCPNDRYRFFNVLSACISLGTNSMTEKDKKLSQCSRQLSSEQEMIHTQLHDVMWLELHAYLNNKRSIPDQRYVLNAERAKVVNILDEIVNFKLYLDNAFFVANSSGLQSASCRQNVTSPTGVLFNSSVPSSPEVAAVVASFHTITLTEETICCQQQALVQVTNLLNKLEHCERLYPTCKHLAKANELYDTEDFKKRVASLCLWLNITRDLSHKIKLIGKVLGVEKISGINWPWMNISDGHELTEKPLRYTFADPTYNTHRNSIPEIHQPAFMRNILAPSHSDPHIIDHSINHSTSMSPITTSDSNPNLLSSPDRKDINRIQKAPLHVIIPRHVQFTSGSEKNSRASTPVILEDSASGRSTPTKPLHLMLNKPIPTYQTLSRASSELSLNDITRTSVYRHFVDKSLKKMGMQKLWLRLRDLLDRTLQRSKEVLEQAQQRDDYIVSDLDDPKNHDISDKLSGHDPLSTIDSQDSNTDAPSVSPEPQEPFSDVNWNQEFIEMGLPSFRASYLFLSRIPLDVMHECLRLRLEQKPKSDPSFLSIRQLIRECKEVLSGAVSAKKYYHYRTSAVLNGEESPDDSIIIDLEQFDTDMAKMFEVYFSYIQSWMYSLQNLPEASRSLKNALEEEWSFTKRICPHVIGGEAEAGKRFSTLATSLISSIADFLETGIDECTRHLYDITLDVNADAYDDGDGIGSGYHTPVTPDNGYATKNGYEPLPHPGFENIPTVHEHLEEFEDDGYEEDGEDEEDDGDYAKHRAFRQKQAIQKSCREFKNLFYEARERASKAIGFAKMLRKDLEIASDFTITVPMDRLMDQLRITGHIRVLAPVSVGYLMFIPDTIIDERTHVLQLLNVTCGREEGEPGSTKTEGYLLMVKCVGCVWSGPSLKVEPTAETTIALSHINVDNLLLVVTHSSHLEKERRDFESLMGHTIRLVNEQTSCHQKITESLAEMKVMSLDLQEKVVESIKQLDERLTTMSNNPTLEENDRNHIIKLCRETVLQCYNFGFEYHKEIVRLVTGDARHRLGRRLIGFAVDWITFVMNKCEKGRGKRPRWATQGLDFLISACEPRILTNLPEKEFQELRKKVDSCISHVIGSADKSGLRPRSQLWTPTPENQRSYGRMVSWPDATAHKMQRSSYNRSAASEPTPTLNRSPDLNNVDPRSRKSLDSSASSQTDQDPSTDTSPDVYRPKARGLSMSAIENDVLPFLHVHDSIDRLEAHREEKLLTNRVIGHVTDKKILDHHISVRRVNFRWQRGIKIGEGQFGKVYTGVNMDTGELMAIKELKCHHSDQKAFKLIADELCNLEGIQHTNVLRYYGVEVHKDEMVIFMEYCDRGTVEDAARLGLPELFIRQYTRDLLLAVSVIHEIGVIHRDIKGANIFLTSNGTLKLGDFGCSVKLKSHMTLPGEVNSLVGSTAFMAPEVIMNNDEGHGRAADIWSLGCVVIEMVTGKRPWHELENNYQIMFRVGMGDMPGIPDVQSLYCVHSIIYVIQYAKMSSCGLQGDNEQKKTRPWHELENNYQIMFRVGMGGTPGIPDNLSSEGKDFLSQCFEVDPKMRATASQLRDHAFVKVYEEETEDTVKH